VVCTNGEQYIDSFEKTFKTLSKHIKRANLKNRLLPVGTSDEQKILIASEKLYTDLVTAKETFISEFKAEQAATKIQSVARRIIAVKKVASMKDQAAAEQAAIKIQSCFRRNKAVNTAASLAAEEQGRQDALGEQLDRALSSASTLFPNPPVDGVRNSLREYSIVKEGPMSDFTKSSGNTGKVIAAASVVAGAAFGTTVGLAAAGSISIPAVASLVTSMKLVGGVLAAIASNPIGLGVVAGVLGAALVAGLMYAAYAAYKCASSSLASDKPTTPANTDNLNTPLLQGMNPAH
jgi:hypothetical protein